MSEALRWAQWWAHAWEHSHTDWAPKDFPTTNLQQLGSLARASHATLAKAFAIAPCVPPTLHPAQLTAQLGLALADTDQWEAVLQWIAAIYLPDTNSPLSKDQNLWCQRIAKALHIEEWPAPSDDPLHLLRAWVAPETWQRLRLRFAQRRILEIEQTPLPVLPQAKLDMLWQAVVWKALSAAS